MVDYHRSGPYLQPLAIDGVDVELVRTYKYLGPQLDDKLDWSELLQMFDQSVVASALFDAAMCWGGSVKRRDAMRLDKLVRRAGSVVGMELDSVVTVAGRRTLSKVLSIRDTDSHPLHSTVMKQGSVFGGTLLSQSSSADRLRRSLVPRAIRLFSSSQRGQKEVEY